MKIKKITIPALLLALSTFSGCASASKTTFNNYWNTDALVMEALNETLTYDVTFEGNADYYGYQLRYENGSYTTELVTSVSESGQNLYTYKTELNIDVIYTLGEESVTLHDLVTSEVVFMPAENGLRPLSSKKSIQRIACLSLYVIHHSTSDVIAFVLLKVNSLPSIRSNLT